LVVADQYEGKGLSIIDLNKKKIIKRVVSIGRGPNEVLYSSPITKTGKRSFQINDTNLNKVLVFSLDSLLQEARNPVVRVIKFDKIQLKSGESLKYLYAINDSLSFGTGIFNKSKYLQYKHTSEGGEIEYKYQYPEDTRKEHQGEDNLAKFWVYQGRMFISPDRKKIAYRSYACYYYELFNIEDGDVSKKAMEIDYLPLYRGEGVFSKENKSGFSAGDVSNDYVYLLFLGRSSLEFGDLSGYSKQLYKINWKGEVEKKYILDRDTHYIAIDENLGRIYATTINPKTLYMELGYYEL